MRPRNVIAPVAAVGAMWLASLPAFAADSASSSTPYPACTSTPTEGDRNAAKGAFAAGNGSFNESDYATAVTYWRDAYRRDCTAHALLLNLARAYELKGEKAESVRALETYIQRKPDDPNAEAIQRRIQNLKAQLVTSAAARPEAPGIAPVPPPGTPLAGASPPVPQAGTPPMSTNNTSGSGAGVAPPAQASSSDDGGSGKSVGPWIVVSAGGVATVLGLVVWSGGQAKISDAEKLCPARTGCTPAATEKGNSGRSQATAGGVVTGIGVAAVAGGLLWHFLWDKGESRPQTGLQVIPTVGLSYSGLSIARTF